MGNNETIVTSVKLKFWEGIEFCQTSAPISPIQRAMSCFNQNHHKGKDLEGKNESSKWNVK